jgi:hypothetical protein
MVQRKPGQLRREDQVAKTFGGANAHQAVQTLAHAGRCAFDREKRGLHRLDLGQQRAPGFGQSMAARLARKQGGADLLFQRLQAACDGGVVYGQTARGADQRASAGQFQKVAQVVPVHGRSFVGDAMTSAMT